MNDQNPTPQDGEAQVPPVMPPMDGEQMPPVVEPESVPEMAPEGDVPAAAEPTE